MIYLDNAATTRQKPPQVIEAVVTAMTTMGNASRGAHSSSLQASRVIYDARCKLARLFGCSRPDHVAFTSNSTEALNLAICGTINAGDHVISTDLEHNSVLRPLYRLQREQKVSLSFVPADRQGRISYNDFEKWIGPKTKAIVCTHASNLTGEVLDMARIGTLAKKHGLLLIADASQTAGSIPIDMEAMGIDIPLSVLSVLSRKKSKLSELRGGVKMYPVESRAMAVAKKIPIEQTLNLSKAMRESEKSLDGEGRILVRYSGTEKKIRLLVEGKNPKKIADIMEILKKSVELDLM